MRLELREQLKHQRMPLAKRKKFVSKLTVTSLVKSAGSSSGIVQTLMIKQRLRPAIKMMRPTTLLT